MIAPLASWSSIVLLLKRVVDGSVRVASGSLHAGLVAVRGHQLLVDLVLNVFTQEDHGAAAHHRVHAARMEARGSRIVVGGDRCLGTEPLLAVDAALVGRWSG